MIQLINFEKNFLNNILLDFQIQNSDQCDKSLNQEVSDSCIIIKYQVYLQNSFQYLQLII